MSTTKSKSSRKATPNPPPDWVHMVLMAVDKKVCIKTGGILIIPAAALCDALVDAAHRFLRGASISGQSAGHSGPAMVGADPAELSRMMAVGHVVGFCAALEIEMTQERAMLLEQLDPPGIQALYAHLRDKKSWPDQDFAARPKN